MFLRGCEYTTFWHRENEVLEFKSSWGSQQYVRSLYTETTLAQMGVVLSCVSICAFLLHTYYNVVLCRSDTPLQLYRRSILHKNLQYAKVCR